MTPLVTAGAGFLIAVLWFDLMFDLHARRARPGSDPLSTIAAYYAHVTTTARPMNRLVGLVMLATVAAVGVQAAQSGGWLAWSSLALVLAAFGIAGGRTFGSARRLGRGTGSPHEAVGLARGILRDHLVCLALMSALLVLQLARG